MPGTRKASHPARRKHGVHAARAMRREPTPAENALWLRIRNRQVDDMKFRRQHSIDRFIVDFYCAEAELVIEIDGSVHDEPNADLERQQTFENLGLRVLRFSNDDVLNEVEEVIAQIKKAKP
jgi:very-short-patch-repair endonuclease